MKFEEIKPFVRNVGLMKGSEGVFRQSEAAYDMTLFYIYEGSCNIKTDSSVFHMKRGRVLLIKAGRFMKIEDFTDGTRLLRISFDYVFDYNTEKGYPMKTASGDEFNKDLILGETVFEDNIPLNSDELFADDLFYLEGRLTDILIEFSNRRNYFEQKLSCEMSSLLTDIIRGSISSLVKAKKEDLDVYCIINYIHQNCCDNLTNSALAEHFHFSIKHINEKVKKATGRSLHQYILYCKISKAIELINNTQSSISEIAYELRFTDLGHFSKVFKDIVGVAPMVYKKGTSI